MRAAVVAGAVVALALLAVTGCARPAPARWSQPAGDQASVAAQPAGSATPTPSAAASATAGASAGPGAPTRTFGVGSRELDLRRSADRPLPTTVWYPAAGAPGTPGTAWAGAPAADGRFPLVLFSHGLTGLPQNYAALTTRLAAAGFVVAAPAYPYTNRNASTQNFADVVNQPADASFVIDAVLKLGQTTGDPLAGHLDPTSIAAAGHSAGGFTTAGMLAGRHDNRLKAGIVIAGGSMGTVTAPTVSVLFIHGDADPTVTYQTGRTAYDRLTWPKAFLTVVGGDHSTYLAPGRNGNAAVVKTMTDFLRATLYNDGPARQRLAGDGTSSATRYEQQHLT